jgi:hypothetical protein
MGPDPPRAVSVARRMVHRRQHRLGATSVNEYQRLFLVQARTDFAVFELLRMRPDLPACHPLHYLQMATELLGKAHGWKTGSNAGSHKAFRGFLRGLSTNRQAQNQLGYENQNESWEHLIRKSGPLAERVERLAPALTPDGPNPEYPWPRVAPETGPRGIRV